MQKHIDEDSAQRQKEINTLWEEKVNVQREIDESVKFFEVHGGVEDFRTVTRISASCIRTISH